MKKRVVIAMSGGVDSSVAACLLKEQGYEVIGVTMCFNLPDVKTKKPRCCGIEGINDARCVAQKIGIRHYVLNMQKILEEKVIKEFCLEYARGRTPNPCIRCNQYVKFGALLKKAHSLRAYYLATGHYARINRLQTTGHRLEPCLLKKAKDKHKDQSYFLYRLNQEQLKCALFPIGNYTKDQVRKLARKFNLPVSEKKESQEICFLPGTDYRKFLEIKIKRALKPGPIVDLAGNLLGEHNGIAFYTIGQREGLRIALGYPVYIIKIDAKQNKITVGKKEDACRKEFMVGSLNFPALPIQKRIALKVKIRYNHQEEMADLTPQGKNIKTVFKKPQFAVTPGQSAVFYCKDAVVGGGIIEKVLD